MSHSRGLHLCVREACVENEVTVTTSDAMKTYLNTQRVGDDPGKSVG